MAKPESIPAPLIIDTYKDVFRAERNGARRRDPLGWIISVPDTHQKTVLAALDKERDVKVLTCSTEDEANGVAAGLCSATPGCSRGSTRKPPPGAGDVPALRLSNVSGRQVANDGFTVVTLM